MLNEWKNNKDKYRNKGGNRQYNSLRLTGHLLFKSTLMEEEMLTPLASKRKNTDNDIIHKKLADCEDSTNSIRHFWFLEGNPFNSSMTNNFNVSITYARNCNMKTNCNQLVNIWDKKFVTGSKDQMKRLGDAMVRQGSPGVLWAANPMISHSHIRSKVTFQRWPAKVSFIFLLEK